jgi:hypothetical protein
MLKNTLAGFVLTNIETLWLYKSLERANPQAIDDISTFVGEIINGLPWYYSLPSKVLLFITGLLCIITTGKSMRFLSHKRRSVFLKYIKIIPLFTALNELIRVLTFLRLFDILPADVTNEL